MNAPTDNQRKDADRDAQAMATLPAKQRRELLKSLLADPLTHYFSATVVQQLLQELESKDIALSNTQAALRSTQDAYQEALNSVTMPKSKAIVKQAKMIARLAECVAEVDDVIEEFQPGSDIEADLIDTLRGWQRNHSELIEAARDGH